MTLKSKAAITYKAAEPLSVEIVNVALPKLSSDQSNWNLTYWQYTLSGRDPRAFSCYIRS